MDHAKPGEMKEILMIVTDANVLVSAKLSPNFTNIANKSKYQPIVVNSSKIQDILIDIRNSFTEIEKLVLRRENGERFSEIPTI